MKRTTRWNIKWIDSVDSTNNEAKRRIESLSGLSVIAAYNQTAGRGQRGNTWLSAPGKNLTFSVVFKYGDDQLRNLNAADQHVINDIISSSIVELLSKYGIDSRIKLPNDIYVGNRKICGILIEHCVCGADLLYSVIGVGLNVNQTEFDTSLPNPTSMKLEIDLEEINLQSLLDELLAILSQHIQMKLVNCLINRESCNLA